MGMTVYDRHDRRYAVGREEDIENGLGAGTQALTELEGTEDKIRGGQTDDVALDATFSQPVGCVQDLGDNCSNTHKSDLGAPWRFADYISSCHHLLPPSFAPRGVGGNLGQCLVSRASRKSEIGRCPVGSAHAGQRM